MSRTMRRRRDRIRQRRNRRLILLAILGAFILLAVAGGAWAGYDYLKGDEKWPDIKTMQPERIAENSIVLAADGSRMGVIQSDQNRTLKKLAQMGTWAPKATVSIEDRRFYEHDGVDWEGVMRAGVANFEAGSAKEGASTITQQVIRNLYASITTEKTLSRKAKEAWLARQLEQQWSKKRILRTYLNLVFYGNNAYGIEAASQSYFSKPSRNLTIPQAAMLAGLPQAPSQYDPLKKGNQPAALNRRNQVLRAMHRDHEITNKQLKTALATPLVLKPGAVYKTRRLPYFFDYVQKQLISQYGPIPVRQGGLRIRTTIDPKLQKMADDAIRSTLGSGGPSGAMAVLDTKTGQIRALGSSVNYADSKYNRVTQTKRQPGSTAKVWALSAFIMDGYNPDSTTYISRPFKIRYKGSTEWWEPKTYSNSYPGAESVRTATVRSDNSVYAQIGLDLGPEAIAAAAHKLGIQSDLEAVWSIVLGSQVVSPLEQTNFYSTIARGGIRSDPKAVTKVTTPGGTDLKLKYPHSHRVMQDWQANTIVSILSDNVRGGTGTAAQISGELVAGKTGTTDDSKDAWFCGMTPKLTACVWMGYEIPTPMGGETGGGRPAQIWRKFMSQALPMMKDVEWFTVKGTPVWVPFTSSWQDNPSFQTSIGADPSAKPKDDDDEDADKDKDKDKATKPSAPTTPAPPTTPTPPTGGETTPTPPAGGGTPPPGGDGGGAPGGGAGGGA